MYTTSQCDLGEQFVMSTVDCKVVLLGSANTGKSCLLQRYIHGCFTTNTQATVAGSYTAKKHTIGNTEIVLSCWDTAGSERYATMSRLYYRKAKAAVICFDLTERTTYERARFWVSELLSTEEPEKIMKYGIYTGLTSPYTLPKAGDCKIYLCGTKSDLIEENSSRRAVKEEEARSLADDLQGIYFETSSKTGVNCGKLFEKIASDFADKKCECKENNKKSTLERDIVNVSWRKDRRIIREKSSCCLKN